MSTLRISLLTYAHNDRAVGVLPHRDDTRLLALAGGHRGVLQRALSRSDLSESQPTATDQPIGDNDIEGNQPIKTHTRDSVGPRSKCVSRSYVVEHYVPKGVQRPSCGKPVRGATQTEQGYSAENNNLRQLN